MDNQAIEIPIFYKTLNMQMFSFQVLNVTLFELEFISYLFSKIL